VRAALDTSILLYAEGLDGIERQIRARSIIDRAASQSLVVPVQAIGELFNVLVRKGRVDPSEAHRIANLWIGRAQIVETTAAGMNAAMDLATSHRLSIWDAVVMAAAAVAECDLLLTEDLNPGFRWRGVTVVNPFAEPISPLLDAFLDQVRG
jgi:predicted nucleic acid-binding protein